MQSHTDESLIQLIVEQQATALEALYDRHAQSVFNLIMRVVKNTDIANEILQETFWQVWQQADKYRQDGSVAAWVYRIARNKSLDQLRRQKARPQEVQTASDKAEQAMWSQLPAEDAEVEPIVELKSDQDIVHQALQDIPQEQRICLELAYFEGLSQRQIAEHTQTPLGTVKTRIRMGMQKLERSLTAAGYQSDNY